MNRKPGIVVANLGDASMARGPVWEGMTFAAMDQFKQLCSDEMKGGLPVIINIMDNQYGMGGDRLAARRWASTSRPVSVPASTRPRCTPSASTATIRWP